MFILGAGAGNLKAQLFQYPYLDEPELKRNEKHITLN